MQSPYQVSSAYVRLMFQSDESIRDGIDDDLMRRLQAALERDFVSGDIVNEVFESVASQGVKSWVTRFGLQLGVGNHGPLGFAALSAPDLLSALEVIVEFFEVRSSAVHGHLRIGENRLHYVLEEKTGHPLAGPWLLESSFLVTQGLIETILAHPLDTSTQLAFAYPRQPWHDEVEALFSPRCVYEAAENELSFPASWAQIPSPLHDPDMYRSSIAQCRELKLAMRNDRSDVRRLVSTRLLNHFDRRLSNEAQNPEIPSLEQLAAELFMSPRTLIRRLAKQQSSYKQILENVRRKRAESLLKDTHLTASEIATKLGYQEAANFGRAFKRWTGSSPAAWRRLS